MLSMKKRLNAEFFLLKLLNSWKIAAKILVKLIWLPVQVCLVLATRNPVRVLTRRMLMILALAKLIPIQAKMKFNRN